MAPDSRKERLTTEDGFHRGAESVMRTLAQHPKTTRGVILGLVLAVVASWAGLSVAHSRAQQVSFALVDAFALLDTPVIDPAAPKVAKPAKTAPRSNRDDQDRDNDDDGDDGDDARDDDGDDGDEATMQTAPSSQGPASFASVASRNAAARAAFAKIAAEHRGPLAVIAALEVAALSDKAQAAAEAEAQSLLRAANAQLVDAGSLLPVAAMREGQLAEDAGDVAVAQAAYERIVASQKHFLGDDAQLQRARLLMAQNDMSGARTALEFIQTNYPRSGVLDEVRIQLAALEATAHAG